MKRIDAVLIGAGQRGKDIYGDYALRHPHNLRFVAVAEPNDERRNTFARLHGIKENRCYEDWSMIFEENQIADVAFICTQDNQHYLPAIEALKKGYHVLLEKPMAVKPDECVELEKLADKFGKMFAIAHVLRYTPFFSTLKRLVEEDKIGRLISIRHIENVGHLHHAHSYVRGNWRNSEKSSPMILAKSCHDMDVLLWLAGEDCLKISSFGSLSHFTKENAPEGSPERCLDGCPADKECPYYAPKQYLTSNTGWPTSVISNDTSLESRVKALKEGPYGRCVYRCDNNVVDHQVVNMEFANEVTAEFTMCAFGAYGGRRIELMGTKGEIEGDMEKNEIQITEFNTMNTETIKLGSVLSGHGGGDDGFISNFISKLAKGENNSILTSASASVQSHLMAFAAEKSRIEYKIIDMKSFRESF